MKFDQGIELIRTALQHPLPGEEAQRLMAPATRKTFEELMASVEDFRESSVMMLLYPDDRGILHTLMIKRPGGDSVHSGQIAFPGGKVEPGDESVEAAALRETEEEVGVPAPTVEIIGRLTKLIIPASRFLVYPHIGVIHSTPGFVPNPEEVQAILKVPVTELMGLKTEQKTFKTSYGTLAAPCFNLYGHDLWGATAMMVSEFRVMMERVK